MVEAYRYVTGRYLDEDKPEMLGGQAVGRQGMAGSNQGGERVCGWWKSTFCDYTKGLKEEDINNPLLFLEAVTMHITT